MPRAWVCRARPSWCQVRPCHRAKASSATAPTGPSHIVSQPEHVVGDVDAGEREDDDHRGGEAGTATAGDERQTTTPHRVLRGPHDAAG